MLWTEASSGEVTLDDILTNFVEKLCLIVFENKVAVVFWHETMTFTSRYMKASINSTNVNRHRVHLSDGNHIFGDTRA